MAIVIKDISFGERTHVLTTPDWTNTMDITFNYSFTLQNTGSAAMNFYWAFIPSTTPAPATWAALMESEGVLHEDGLLDGYTIARNQTKTYSDNTSLAFDTWWTTTLQTQRAFSLKMVVYNASTDAFLAEAAVPNFFVLDARYSPSIPAFSVERTGDEAETIKVTLKLGLAADLTDTQKARMIPKLVDGSGTEITLHYTTLDDLLTGVVDSTTIVTNTFDKAVHHDLTLTFGDSYESASAKADIDRSFANLHLSGKSTGGACFGGFCTSTEGNPKLETYYPIYAYAGIAVGGGGAYSTDEVDTGSKWIDGKTIYRKVVEFTAIKNGRANDMAIGASGTIETIVGYRGMGYKTGKTYYWSIPHYDTRSQYTIMIELVMGDAPLIRLTPGSGRDLAYAFVVVEYTLADAAEGS